MIVISLLSGLLRRLLGGWMSDASIIKERGVQWFIGVLLYGSVIYAKVNWLGDYNTWLFDWLPLWLFALLGALAVVLCLTDGHFPGFMCGTESRDYIEEQIAKGRDIPFRDAVDWIGSYRGFVQYGTEWCFWQLLFCKLSACIIPSLFFGLSFMWVGLVTALAYPAMFHAKLRPVKNIVTSPTGYGEFIQGFFIIGAML